MTVRLERVRYKTWHRDFAKRWLVVYHYETVDKNIN